MTGKQRLKLHLFSSSVLLSWKYSRSVATLGFIVKETAICGEMFPLEILKVHIKENNNEHYFNINWKIYFSSVKLIRLKSPWETCSSALNLNTSQQFTASFCQLFPKPLNLHNLECYSTTAEQSLWRRGLICWWEIVQGKAAAAPEKSPPFYSDERYLSNASLPSTL